MHLFIALFIPFRVDSITLQREGDDGIYPGTKEI